MKNCICISPSCAKTATSSPPMQLLKWVNQHVAVGWPTTVRFPRTLPRHILAALSATWHIALAKQQCSSALHNKKKPCLIRKSITKHPRIIDDALLSRNTLPRAMWTLQLSIPWRHDWWYLPQNHIFWSIHGEHVALNGVFFGKPMGISGILRGTGGSNRTSDVKRQATRFSNSSRWPEFELARLNQIQPARKMWLWVGKGA